jgi:general secretion pathway protein G
MISNKKSRQQHGFTLIELLIVMAIMGMLAAIVGPTLIEQIGGSRKDAARTQISQLESAIEIYRLDMFKLPNSLEDLVKNSSNSPKWKGPYMSKGYIPKDPWDNEYQYKKPGGEGRKYDIYSFGADGQEGGEEDNADVYNLPEK